MENGIQVSSLKPLLCTEAQVAQAFANMRALGCTTVQLQWIDPAVSPEFIAGCLKANGMVSVSVQDFYVTIREHWDSYVALNAVTGGKWLCVSRIPEEYKSRHGLDVFIAELRAQQKKLDGLGQKLCFHPVSADFTAVPGMDAVEYLLEAMPELDLCLDLYHLDRNCADMPAYIRRYGKRVCMVHFKDGRDGKLVPAGQGEVHWDGVFRACLDAGIPYGFVEQETWDRDPYVRLKEAMDWVNAQIHKEKF